MKKKIIITSVILSTLVALFIYTNKLEGIYISTLAKKAMSSHSGYIVLHENKVYAIDIEYNSQLVTTDQVGSYQNQGKKVTMKIKGLDETEVSSSHLYLNIKEYKKWLDGEPLHSNELRRIYNPLLKNKIYEAIQKHENQKIRTNGST